MTDVFISYKRRIRDRVAPIADALRELGLEVWFDAHIGVGTGFITEINKQVRAAKCVLVCWTPDAFEIEDDNPTSWVVSEASIGRQRKVLVPVMLEPTDIYAPFNTFHTEDLTFWPDGEISRKAWTETLSAIGVMIDRPGLGTYAAAAADGSVEALRAWVTRYPEDKLADPVWDRIASMEAEALRQRLAADRKAAVEAAAAAKIAADARVKADAEAKVRAAENAKRVEAELIEARQRAETEAEAARLAAEQEAEAARLVAEQEAEAARLAAEQQAAADEVARLANEQRVLTERAEAERLEAQRRTEAAARAAQAEEEQRREREQAEALAKDAQLARQAEDARAWTAANDAAAKPSPREAQQARPTARLAWPLGFGLFIALVVYLVALASAGSGGALIAGMAATLFPLPFVITLYRARLLSGWRAVQLQIVFIVGAYLGCFAAVSLLNSTGITVTGSNVGIGGAALAAGWYLCTLLGIRLSVPGMHLRPYAIELGLGGVVLVGFGAMTAAAGYGGGGGAGFFWFFFMLAVFAVLMLFIFRDLPVRPLTVKKEPRATPARRPQSTGW